MAEVPKKDNSKKLEDLLIIFVKYRKLIFINVLLVTIASVIISLLISNKYTATASFISPKKKGGLFGDIGGFSSSIKDLSRTLGGRLGTVSDEAYNYLVILQSRTASQKMIQKFNLRDIYEIDKDKPYEDVIKALRGNVDFNIEDEGNIVISVTDKIPERAAEMANYYVQILNEISTELSITESRNNREFIEKRFIQAQNDILTIEDSLENFSKKYNVLAIEDQIKAAIGVAAEIKAKLEIAKLELEILTQNYGDNNPLVQQANLKVDELIKQLGSLRFGEDKNLKSSLNVFVPFEKVPETGILYIRLKRNYEIQNKILEFIYPIYEQAKIEEQKNIPVVLVVDNAIPPEKKSSPRRSLIVIGAFLISFFFSLAYALIKESYSSMQTDQDRFKKVKTGIIDPLKSSFRFRTK
jgi:tyrosine-protein kinase Etk/Wzc